jgi:hypothetical protein
MHAGQKRIKIQKEEPTIESGNSKVVVFGKNHEQLFDIACSGRAANFSWIALL